MTSSDLTVFVRSALSETESIALTNELKRLATRVLGPNESTITLRTLSRGQSTMHVTRDQIETFRKAFGLTALNDEALHAALTKRAKTEYTLLTRGENNTPLHVELMVP